MAKGGRRVRIFSALEVANICGVVNQTAINWIRNGHLKAFTTPGGQYRIYAKDLAAFLDKRGMSASGEVLQVMMENADWNTFMIAADQSVNDTIKADIGKLFPGYAIVQASDWFEIGRKITEEKPGFVLLDAGLPGVDISGFIHTVKNDPFFGRPFVILMTDNHSQSQDETVPKGEPSPHFGSATGSTTRGSPDVVLTKPLDIEKLEAAIKNLESQLDAAAVIA